MNNDTAAPTTRGCLVHCELRDNILEVAITGLLISAEALRLHHTLLQYLHAETSVRGVVVDLRKALVLLDDDFQPLSGVDEASPKRSHKGKTRPVAVIVTREVESRFLPWAWEMAAAGLVRAAFVDHDEAFAWIRARGKHSA